MVKVTAERIPESQIRLDIEVEPERIEQSVEKAYRKLVGRLNVPGFRRGKAPRHIVERYVGRETLFQEGIEQLLTDVYREAIKDLDLHPIDQPELDLQPKVDELQPGEPLRITATVPLRPTAQIGDYRSIRLPRAAVEVTPEEVNRIIDRIRDQQTEWVPVQRPVREGDRVVMDVHGEVGTYTRLYSPSGEPLATSGEGQTILDEHQAEFEVETSSTRYPAGFVDQLVGMAPGQEKQFELSLPADYKDPDLANKLAIFKVKVDEVKEKHEPAIDDELAKSIGYESLEQMREGIRERAQAQAEARAAEIHEDAVINEAINLSTFEIPPALINHEIDHLIEHARERLRRNRLELDEYLRLTRKSESELREEFREEAVRNVKTALLFDRIAEQEHITATPDEVNREIEMMAAIAGRDAERVRQVLSTPEQREALALRIRNDKVVKLLVDIAQTGQAAESTAEAVEQGAEAAAGAAIEQEVAVATGEATPAPTGGAEAAPETGATEAGAATTEQQEG